HGLDLAALAHVGGGIEHLDPEFLGHGLPELLDLPHVAESVEDQVRTCSGEGAGDPQPYAARGPGDDRRPATEHVVAPALKLCHPAPICILKLRGKSPRKPVTGAPIISALPAPGNLIVSDLPRYPS